MPTSTQRAPEGTAEATYSTCTRAAAQRRGQVAENQGAPHRTPKRLSKEHSLEWLVSTSKHYPSPTALRGGGGGIRGWVSVPP